MIDGCSIYETIWAQPKPGSEDMTLTGYEKRQGVAYLSVENTGAEADISVPIFNYGHCTAADTVTGTAFPLTSGENARVVLTIPAGYTGTIAHRLAEPCVVAGLRAALPCVRRRMPDPGAGTAPQAPLILPETVFSGDLPAKYYPEKFYKDCNAF